MLYAVKNSASVQSAQSRSEGSSDIQVSVSRIGEPRNENLTDRNSGAAGSDSPGFHTVLDIVSNDYEFSIRLISDGSVSESGDLMFDLKKCNISFTNKHDNSDSFSINMSDPDQINVIKDFFSIV